MMCVKDSAWFTSVSLLHKPCFRCKFAEEVLSMGCSFARIELLLDTLLCGGAALRDDCHDCHCQPGLTWKIYYLVVFDLIDSVKMQRQISPMSLIQSVLLSGN